MGLGKILGSISPAFGMLSGKGLFGHLPLNAIGQSGLGGILGMLLSHGSHGADDPAPVDAGGEPPMGTMPGGLTPQNVSQMAPGALPSGPGTMNQLGSALAGSSGGGDFSAGLSALQGPNHRGLQAILQSLGVF